MTAQRQIIVRPRRIPAAFSVAFAYPVHFTRGVFAPDNPLLADILSASDDPPPRRAAVFCDSGLAAAQPGLLPGIARYFRAHANRLILAGRPVCVPGGEIGKAGNRLWQRIARQLLAWRLCRHSYVVIVGGGAVLDTVGFAASLVHRGLRVVRVPTTALAQCDSGVGVKTAVNFGPGKNLIGTFAPPFAVLNDLDLLDSLPAAEWTAGIAEAFKVAIIKDAAGFRFLCRHAAELRAGHRPILEEMVVRSARLHLAHIQQSGDPFEFGRARPLDFGHWSAHKLETLSRHRIGHGQAVGAGIALDSIYARLIGWLTERELAAILSSLRAAGVRLWYDELGRRDRRGRLLILDGLRDFQEHLGGELCVTLPQRIGRKQEIHAMDPELIARARRQLQQFAGGRAARTSSPAGPC